MQAKDKLLRRALAGETGPRPPVWLMRQAGRYLPEYRELRKNAGSFLDLCFTPELAVEVTVQPIRRFGMDAAILFSDILVVPHALGQPVSFVEGEGPRLEPVRSAAEITDFEAAIVVDRLAPVFETIERLHQALPEETTLIGFAGAPWTVATYMVEGGSSRNFAHVKGWSSAAPDAFQALIDVLVDATSAYLIEQVARGVEVVQLFDTWAGALSEAGFERWCLAPIIEIARRVKEAWPDIPVIVFPRGVGVQYVRFARESVVDAVSIDSAVPVAWAKRELQPHGAVQGNLDPISLIAGGAVLEREAEHILATLGTGPFVFNLGHGIVPETPPENVARLIEIVRGWRG